MHLIVQVEIYVLCSITNQQYIFKKLHCRNFQTWAYRASSFHFPSLLGKHRHQSVKNPSCLLASYQPMWPPYEQTVLELDGQPRSSYLAGITFCRDKLTLDKDCSHFRFVSKIFIVAFFMPLNSGVVCFVIVDNQNIFQCLI